MGKLRVLVVDSSVVIRRLLTNVLACDPSLEVVGTAPTGRIAMAKVPQVNPDVIALSSEMPVQEGAQILEALRKTHPGVPVIVFAPRIDAQRISDELIPRIKMCHRAPAQGALARTPVRGGLPATSRVSLERALERRTDLVLIVQHTPASFTASLADRLNTVCDLGVSEGVANEVVRPGHVWIAPGGFHMIVRKDADLVRIQTHQGPPENSCRPSADVLFRSAADVYGAHVLAVVLTGMGQDGFRGCERLREAGGQVFVQDEASSVIWGMPGFVARAGLADKVLPLRQLGREIGRSVRAHRALWPQGSSPGRPQRQD
jgi:two-component system chemotaxis response regulator CheB